MYAQNLEYYWRNKKGRAELALQHTEEMEVKYSKAISDCIVNTVTYSQNLDTLLPENGEKGEGILISLTSTEAIFKYSKGKTAILNFASYKEPGGGFLAGSRAQEECLCHDSFLYNVLKEKKKYYEWNNLNKNSGLYTNRALYSPNVIFEKDTKSISCDVITCAAPNYSIGLKYGNIPKTTNSITLDSRIKFILDIAVDQKVDTLILGAFGCGVFAQDPEQVATIFKKYLKQGYENCFKRIVFAIPRDVNTNNYDKFLKVFSQ